MDSVSSVDQVFVCGGGHQGLSMAAHLALNGLKVSLWNRTLENIIDVVKTKKIECSGIINQTAFIENAGSDIKDLVSDFVMVTTPSFAHKDIAKELAPYVHKDMIIVLNPGRTFGAFEFARTLRECGVNELPHICETQTIVYTCRKNSKNSITIYSLKKGVKIASLNKDDIGYVMKKMPKCLVDYFEPVESVYITSLSNVGMVLHCAPVLMNIGWIESEKFDFKYYYDGISPSVADFIEKIDAERLEVAGALGYKVESTVEWMRRSYNIQGRNLYECIKNNKCYERINAPKSINSRYITEDIPCGLVPIEDIGKNFGIRTPNISIIIDLANSIFDTDFRDIGRKYNWR